MIVILVYNIEIPDSNNNNFENQKIQLLLFQVPSGPLRCYKIGGKGDVVNQTVPIIQAFIQSYNFY